MKTQYNLVTQWLANDGTQNTGSDERLISTHETFDDAKKALETVQIRHPHNHAEIIEVDSPASPAHTATPWAFVSPHPGQFAIIPENRQKHVATHTLAYIRDFQSNDEANAVRIIACVNACAGMTDPAAEIKALRDALEAAIDIMDGREAGSERVDALAQAREALCTFGGEAGK